MGIAENIIHFKEILGQGVTLVAVSKTKPNEDLMEAYKAGQRIFGENKIQEMVEKWEALPKDIEWHMIGHVQRNKVKYMAPFVSLIHAVDSLKLLREIDKEAAKNNRSINCLLQIKIAEEDSKFGIDANKAKEILDSQEYRDFENVKVIGLMGMATFTENKVQIKTEFQKLKAIFNDYSKDNEDLKVLSMGMSGDYEIALECGSTMVRIGSSLFGEREV